MFVFLCGREEEKEWLGVEQRVCNCGVNIKVRVVVDLDLVFLVATCSLPHL